jgi:galactokinase
LERGESKESESKIVMMYQRVKDKFHNIHGKDIGCIVTANGRANIIGEHTDYHYGYVFPFAIDSGIVFCGSKSESLSIYSLNFDAFFIKSQEHPKGSWQSYVSNALTFIEKKYGIDIMVNLVFGGNLPIGAGVSSSSALCCGLIEVINNLYGLGIDQIDKVNLASEIEHGTGVTGGKMDQYTILFAKENSALILDCRDLSHENIAVPQEWSFVLINSGVKHNLAHTAYNDRRKDGERALALLKTELPHITSLRDLSMDELEQFKGMLSIKEYNRAFHVLNENKRVMAFKAAMMNEDFETCGQLLNQSHESLRDLYDVSCDELDTLQSLACQTSFISGSRMMGGGFGGCTINLVKSIDESALSDMIKKFNVKYGYTPEVYNIKPATGLKVHE